MRAKEMRDRTLEELEKMLVDTRADLFRARLDNATHQLEKPHRIGTARREIARINTIINEMRQQDVEQSAYSLKSGEE